MCFHITKLWRNKRRTHMLYMATYIFIDRTSLWKSRIVFLTFLRKQNAYSPRYGSARWVHNKIISEWMKILSATIIFEFYCAQNVIDIRECTTLYDFAIHSVQFSSLKIIFSLPEKALIAFKKGDGNCLSSILSLSSKLLFFFCYVCYVC